MEGGCRFKTARAVVHRVELVEAGGACETTWQVRPGL